MPNPEIQETASTTIPAKEFSVSAFNDEIDREGFIKAILDRPREAAVEAGEIAGLGAIVIMSRGRALPLRGAAQEAVSSEAAAELDWAGQGSLRQLLPKLDKPLELAPAGKDFLPGRINGGPPFVHAGESVYRDGYLMPGLSHPRTVIDEEGRLGMTQTVSSGIQRLLAGAGKEAPELRLSGNHGYPLRDDRLSKWDIESGSGKVNYDSIFRLLKRGAGK